MKHARYNLAFPLAIFLTGGSAILSACGGPPDRIVVNDRPGSLVSLESFPKRGATGRYPGSLRSIKANHPIILSPDLLARVLAGIQIGVIPSDPVTDSRGIKPTPLFTPADVAGLTPAIANALKQAAPDHYVTVQVGSASETTGGTLYVDGPVIRFTLTHYRSVARQRDAHLAIYALSFVPETAQASAIAPQDWMEREAHNPRLAIEYGRLSTLNPPQDTMASPNAESAPAPLEATPADMQRMKATVEKQAQELESLKAELDALRKQLEGAQRHR
jgi:hypothetical protein